MGWRRNEVWVDIDVLWFREQSRALALDLPLPTFEPPLSRPDPNGIERSRQRRRAREAARKKKLATRTVPAVALVLGSATMLPIGVFRQGGGERQAGPLQEDPPSLTFGLDLERLEAAGSRTLRQAASTRRAGRAASRTSELGQVHWHRATSAGLWYSGHLENGTQLPVEGPDWVTWNPVTDSVPNLPHRLYGNERTVRTLITVISA